MTFIHWARMKVQYKGSAYSFSIQRGKHAQSSRYGVRNISESRREQPVAHKLKYYLRLCEQRVSREA